MAQSSIKPVKGTDLSRDDADAKAWKHRPHLNNGLELFPIWVRARRLAPVVGEAASGYFVLCTYMMALALVMQLVYAGNVYDNASADPARSSQGSAAGRFVLPSLANHADRQVARFQHFVIFAATLCLVVATVVVRLCVVSFGRRADRLSITPSDFAVHINHLPKKPGQFTEEDVRSLFAHFGDIEHVAIGYQVGQLVHVQKELMSIRARREKVNKLVVRKGENATMRYGCKLCVPAKRVLWLLDEAETRKMAELQEVAKDPVTNCPSGHAIVTFSTPDAAEQCYNLMAYTRGVRRVMRCTVPSRSLFLGEHFIKVDYPDGEPDDIFWEHLQYSANARRRRAIGTWLQVSVTSAIAAAAMVASTFVKQRIVDDCAGSDSLQCGSVGITLLTAIPSAIVSFAATRTFSLIARYARNEKHHTESTYKASVLSKSTIAHLVLSGGVLFILFNNPDRWWERGNLVDQATYNLLADAVVPPLQVAATMLFKRCWRIRTGAKNAVTQEDMDKAYQLPAWDAHKALSGLVNLTGLAFLFASLIPYSWTILALGALFHAAVHRWLLTRRSRIPRLYAISLVIGAINVIQATIFWALLATTGIYVVFFPESAPGAAGSTSERDLRVGIAAAWLSLIVVVLLPIRRCLQCMNVFSDKPLTDGQRHKPFRAIGRSAYVAPEPSKVIAAGVEMSRNRGQSVEEMNQAMSGAGLAVAQHDGEDAV